MAAITIPMLTQAIALNGDEQMEVVQSGVSMRTTSRAVAALNTTPGPAGPQGPAGPAGPAGPGGPTGPVYGPTTATTYGALPSGTTLGQLGYTIDRNLWQWNNQWLSTLAAQSYQVLFQCGFVGDGVTDDSAAINAAIALGGHVTFPPRWHIKINSGIIIKSGFTTVDFNGCWVDAVGMTAGYALSFVNDPTPTPFPNTTAPGLYGLFTAANAVSNLLLTGPNSTSNITDGVFFGTYSGSGQVSGQTFQNVQIWGFRVGNYIGNNTYLNTYINVNIINCWQYGMAYNANTNAGENWTWIGGRIANCNNGGGGVGSGAIGLYMQPAGGGHNELNCQGVSFDYCDNPIVVYGGILTLTGHVEDGKDAGVDNPNPMIQIMGQASSQATGVRMLGGSIAPTNQTPTTRPSLVTIDAGYNPKTFFIAACRWSTYGNAATFVTVNDSLSTGNVPQVSLAGSIVDFNAPNGSIFPSTSPTALNRIANPGFDGSANGTGAGTFTAWTQTKSSGQTFTIVTTPVHSGTYAAQLVGTNGAQNASISQNVVVVPGQQYNCRLWINLTAYTSGTVYATVHFYSYDGTLLISINQVPGYVATTSGYTPALLSGTVPNTASLASVQVYLNGFVGTVCVDDVEFYAF